MTFILITLIAALLTGVVTLFFSSEMVGELYITVFDCGKYLTTVTGVKFFNLLMPTTYGIGLSLIVLKFLKKAFDIYVLWTDGDPDADPFLLLTNFVRAVGTALVFQWVYGLFVDICQELTKEDVDGERKTVYSIRLVYRAGIFPWLWQNGNKALSYRIYRICGGRSIAAHHLWAAPCADCNAHNRCSGLPYDDPERPVFPGVGYWAGDKYYPLY